MTPPAPAPAPDAPRPGDLPPVDALPVDTLDAPRLAETDALATEWVLTNALGGFAMGTVLGVPTRRYHGYLIASLSPPVRRVLALAQIAETLILRPPGQPELTVHLQPFHFADSPERPAADPRLARFERGDGCRWVYEFRVGPHAVRVERRVTLADRRNACTVEYGVETGGVPWRLELRPLTPLRDFHELSAPDEPPPELHRSWTDATGRPWVALANHLTGLTLSCDVGEGEPARFHAEPHRWGGIEHAWELRRGLPGLEDAHAPGVFTIASRGSAGTIVLSASIDAMEAVDAHLPRADRRRAMIAAARDRAGITPADPHARTLARLACAADDFVVRRDHAGVEGRSIIAGYPWFSDWGRDSMIALPGLLLVTGRHDEALGVLTTFADARRNGLIPNRFDDDAGPAHYNTADASLWFVHACCRYLRATADRAGFFDALAPACMDIVQAHRQGTDYAIGADPADGLVHAGDEHTQLTWMDARRDGVTFTPRCGKPVEINALWHNALASLAGAFKGSLDAEAAELRTMADRVARAFATAFTGGPGGGLIDCLFPDAHRWRASTEIRPNQIFAVSLPHSPLGPDAQRRVVGVVREHLLTPVGLRTLSPTDPGYRPRFEGPLFNRDAAYHNGTVWPWLLGPFVEATLRVDAFSPAARQHALALLAPLVGELDGASIGQLWEVYDADEPRRPDGCIAQAWSVAETLRVLVLALAPRH